MAQTCKPTVGTKLKDNSLWSTAAPGAGKSTLTQERKELDECRRWGGRDVGTETSFQSQGAQVERDHSQKPVSNSVFTLTITTAL